MRRGAAIRQDEPAYEGRGARTPEQGPWLARPRHGPRHEQVQRGAGQGVCRAGIDPVELYISMSGPDYFDLSMIVDHDLKRPEIVARQGAQCGLGVRLSGVGAQAPLPSPPRTGQGRGKDGGKDGGKDAAGTKSAPRRKKKDET